MIEQGIKMLSKGAHKKIDIKDVSSIFVAMMMITIILILKQTHIVMQGHRRRSKLVISLLHHSFVLTNLSSQTAADLKP